MNEPLQPVTTLILAVTGIVSFIGFNRRDFCERYLFSPERVLRFKEYERVVTSGFLHADGFHLTVNLISFYAFARWIEYSYGAAAVLVIYFAAIVGGGLLSLFLHRFHDYRALGASGGVCGIIFAHIFLLPGGGIYMFPIPFAIPAWLYAIIFPIVSYVGMRRQADNIGHDAHLGGAIIGLLAATVMYPQIVAARPWLYFGVMALSTGLFVHVVKHPLHVPGGLFPKRAPEEDNHPRYSTAYLKEPREVDRILQKISSRGMESLTGEERELLERHAEKLRRGEGGR